LSGVLSASDQEQQAVETAEAIVREEENARRLAKDADVLLAADQAFLDEIGNLVGQRRIPVGEELRQYLEDFVGKRYPGSTVPAELANGAGILSVSPEVGTEMRRLLPNDTDAGRVSRRLELGPFEATFDQQVAVTRPRAELIYA